LGWSLPILFSLALLSWYEWEGYRYQQFFSRFEKQLAYLEQEKVKYEQERVFLLECIASESDSAWVEIVLKKELGVVAKGSKKVLFGYDFEWK
jgi:hypothetical protein